MNLASNHMVFIGGQKRYGKTVLATWIFENMKAKRKVIINPKNDRRLAALYPPQWGKYKIKNGVQNVVVPADIVDKRAYDDYFKPIWEEGNVHVLIDEYHIIGDERRWPPTLQAIYRLGSDRGIGVTAVTQRASRIPVFTRSESDHYFLYRLGAAADRKALEEDSSVDWSGTGNLEKYQCLYWSPGMEAPEPFRWNSKGQKFLDLYNTGR